MLRKRTICVITGSRAEYGLLRPVMRAIEDNPRLALKVVAAGMHLSKRFGMTVNEILKDFSVDARVPMTPAKDSPAAMAASIGVGIRGFVAVFEKSRPDVVVVLGDRVEALAAAVAASYMNIPVAHIHGGDRSGSVDENARHAITKLSHIHFAATRQSAARILKMGEEKWRVHVTGAPGLDGIRQSPQVIQKVLKLYGLQKPFVLVVQHPVSTQATLAACQIHETLEAVSALKMPVLIIRANADSGGRAINAVIGDFIRQHPGNKAVTSMPREHYLALLQSAAVLVGNSSSGIIEAPYLGTAVVDVGNRQQGRESTGPVMRAPHDSKAIVRAVRRGMKIGKGSRRESVFGAGKRIAHLLARVPLTPKLIEKQISY